MLVRRASAGVRRFERNPARRCTLAAPGMFGMGRGDVPMRPSEAHAGRVGARVITYSSICGRAGRDDPEKRHACAAHRAGGCDRCLRSVRGRRHAECRGARRACVSNGVSNPGQGRRWLSQISWNHNPRVGCQSTPRAVRHDIAARTLGSLTRGRRFCSSCWRLDDRATGSETVDHTTGGPVGL